MVTKGSIKKKSSFVSVQMCLNNPFTSIDLYGIFHIKGGIVPLLILIVEKKYKYMKRKKKNNYIS